MLTTLGLISAGGAIAIKLGSSAWAKYKVERQMRIQGELPLFDLVVLEIATTPRDPADDPAVLVQIREILTGLNHRKYAADGADPNSPVIVYAAKLPADQQPTAMRAAQRLSDGTDPWLASVGATMLARVREGTHF